MIQHTDSYTIKDKSIKGLGAIIVGWIMGAKHIYKNFNIISQSVCFNSLTKDYEALIIFEYSGSQVATFFISPTLK